MKKNCAQVIHVNGSRFELGLFEVVSISRDTDTFKSLRHCTDANNPGPTTADCKDKADDV